MTDLEALEILRAEGHAVSAIDVRTGRVKVWIHRTGDPVEVETGKELRDLAEGRLTLEEIRERREHGQALAHATPGSEGRA